MKCYFTGCKKSAVNEVKAKWQPDHIFCTCAEHTPGAGGKLLPIYLPRIDAYIVEPIKQMEIKVNKVEGKTSKKGTKQGLIYSIIKESAVKNFFIARSAGREYSIWNVNGDWTKIGIAREGVRRYSYSTDFSIL